MLRPVERPWPPTSGVVPVLWHDNLPQVAIEMHARHIPLLTSDMGGAQELGNCPEMVFAALQLPISVERRIDSPVSLGLARNDPIMIRHVAQMIEVQTWDRLG